MPTSKTEMDQMLCSIARRFLNVPTLKPARTEPKSFQEMSVWQIEAALTAAFEAGETSARKTK